MKRVLFGISGSIGVLGIYSYLLRLIAEEQLELMVIMTPSATRFVSASALAALTRAPVHTAFWEGADGGVSPPELARQADVMLVAPASATTLARCANGNADTLLSASYLCFDGPTLFAPSMDTGMLRHPAVQENLARLRAYGATILPCAQGYSVSRQDWQNGALCNFDTLRDALRQALAGSAALAPARQTVQSQPGQPATAPGDGHG